MSDEYKLHQQHLDEYKMYQQHLWSRLKYVSMNNWNYTEYILIVPHYLINNCVNLQ
jgi:hypothetical protein